MKATETETRQNKDQKIIIPWATNFKSLLKLSETEKYLNKEAMITYKRPPALSNILINYKSISLKQETNGTGTSRNCGHCGLCGNHGKLKTNMVEETTTITRKDGKVFSLKQNLTCKDYGIYVAQCRICLSTYVGQTITPFSTRWNTHRSTWNRLVASGKMEAKEEDHALLYHYATNHNKEFQVHKELAKSYTIIFVERTSKNKLDTAESFWISKLKSEINIARTFLPYCK